MCSKSLYGRSSTVKRAYTTATKATAMKPGASKHATPLSSALRKFYLKVHPDLFAGHPEEQKQNEASFAKLNEYLENYKQEVETTTPCNLEFHVRVVGEGGSVHLKKVTASLMMPSRHSSAEAREHILKHNLMKLFRQCDYHEEIDVSGYGSSTKKLRSAGSNETSFISVLMAASLRFKGTGKKSASQVELDKTKESQRANNLKLQEKLQKTYGVKFAIEVPAIIFKSPVERLNLIKSWLEAAGSALEELKMTTHKMELLKDKTLLFGYKKQGPVSAAQPHSIYLDINEQRSSWVDTLRAVNPESDAKLRERLTKIAQMELSVATATGFKKIESSTAVVMRHLDQYETLLQRLHMHADAKASEWNKLHPNRSRITVRIMDRIDGVFAAESHSGTLFFPVGNNVTDLISVFNQYGPQLIAEHRELEAALGHIKDRYNLSQLVIAPDVTGENAVECLNRLVDGFHVLRQYLTGINMCISNNYAANEDSKILFVKYDFLF